MSQLVRPLLRASKTMSLQLKNKSYSKINLPFSIQSRKFSGPLEPHDSRKPEDVEPDYWDARHWEWIIDCIEFEIKHYDPEWSVIPIDDLQYDLKFAKKMHEWRSLEPNKYLTDNEMVERGQIDSIFGITGYKMRAELDHRIIGGRGGVDTKESFYNDSYIYGPFGTEENPVLVPSYNRFRFVSCMGGYDGKTEHDMAWFVVRQGPKHRCPLCGQIFQLWTTDSSHPDHPYHDPNRNYEKELINMIWDHQDAFGGFFPHHNEVHHHGHDDHGHGHSDHGHGHSDHGNHGNHGHSHDHKKSSHH